MRRFFWLFSAFFAMAFSAMASDSHGSSSAKKYLHAGRCPQAENRMLAKGESEYRILHDTRVRTGYGPCIAKDGSRTGLGMSVEASRAVGWYKAGDIVILPAGYDPGKLQPDVFQGCWRKGCGNDLVFLDSIPKMEPVKKEESSSEPPPDLYRNEEEEQEETPPAGITRNSPCSAALPVVVTGEASSVGEDFAILNGTVSGNPDTVWFEYYVPPRGPNKSVKDKYGSVEVKGLRPGTTYLFHMFASNCAGSTHGKTSRFTTEKNFWQRNRKKIMWIGGAILVGGALQALQHDNGGKGGRRVDRPNGIGGPSTVLNRAGSSKGRQPDDLNGKRAVRQQ